MTWLAWRQQRSEILAATAILLLLTAILVPTGLGMAWAFDRDELAGCLGQTTPTCLGALDSFERRFEGIIDATGWFSLLPLLIGVLFAAPLVVELDRGTHRLAWTQSITRRRWLVTKLGLITVGATAYAALLAGLITWWRAPVDDLYGRLRPAAFQLEGIVPIAYTLFAVGLVLAAGTVLRRPVPAIGVAAVLFVTVRVLVETYVRPHYQPAVHLAGDSADAPRLAWMIRSGPSTTYQPADRFWLFQGIETVTFVAAAACLVGIAVWRIRTRSR
ncbi:hypothetical protein I6A84_20090 [Frankia sp. CNm7]|uniref:ABC-2 family transporter protein n=1 Tax=Frankia nepalensis TaxID=1836974 RepID=A0A937RH97_9ACTN|nr:hypothetical protein [Frankia nepalensis]MBL7495633.1 hypothetical protein [Frankia nepalensis]MBL7508879.1 hypothetical protein [Frankia nepalensis]MBL7520327.1 hypothetical protein [Frankia nepalensis]MBL7630102.1 hypothetical protein [Frankia nepalensis]